MISVINQGIPRDLPQKQNPLHNSQTSKDLENQTSNPVAENLKKKLEWLNSGSKQKKTTLSKKKEVDVPFGLAVRIDRLDFLEIYRDHLQC